ncbi:MAG TPA: zinc-ribbon domain-containing protein [Clostridia bacterium]
MRRRRIIPSVILILIGLSIFFPYIRRPYFLYIDFFDGFFILPVISFIIIAIAMGLIISGIIKNRERRHDHDTHYFTDSADEDYRSQEPRQYEDYYRQEPGQYRVYREISYKCPMCGSEYEPDQKFCVNCGNKLKD